MIINFRDIVNGVKRHLSYIGKRAFNKNGENIFSNITTSSAEDPLFLQYVNAAAQNIESSLHPVLAEWYEDEEEIELSVVNTRQSPEFEDRLLKLITTYVTRFTLAEYLNMMHPDMAKTYEGSAQVAMQALLTFAFSKLPPSMVPYSYNEVTGIVENND